MLRLELKSLPVHNLKVNLLEVVMHPAVTENQVQSKEQRVFQRVVNLVRKKEKLWVWLKVLLKAKKRMKNEENY